MRHESLSRVALSDKANHDKSVAMGIGDDDFRLHAARLLTGAERRAIRGAMKTVICIICRKIIR
ncbi:hypothetical protein LCM4579_13320 [Ensifer sp. LCM 4579]|nr:hypothetical protein LCM4579_13320 [Ensifer sp. LCM 4579]